MTENPTRVRIVHDESAEDPRDWTDMCEIVRHDRWNRSTAELIADLIIRTNAWEAAMQFANVADPAGYVAYDLDCKLIDDEAFRDQWLDAVKDELIVEKFRTPHETYLAHTTPSHCKVTGTPWELAGEAMSSSIETFKHWAEGDVYGYVIEECIDVADGDWIEVDSCWGFYGPDPFKNGISEHVPEELHDQLRNAEIEYNY